MKSLLMLTAAVLFLMAGCAAKPTIIGTWSETSSPGNSITYAFKADHTYTYEEHAAYQSIHSHQYGSGTYTLTGQTLSLDARQETMGIDPDAMAAIDARERAINPNVHIIQDKGDIPVIIEQPISNYVISLTSDRLVLRDTSNAADHGRTYERVD